MDARALMDASADGMLVADEAGRVLFCNAAAAQMLARPAARLVGCDVRDLLASDDEEPSIEMRAAPIEWEGSPAQLTSLRDVSERRRAEERYRRATETLAALIDATPVAIVRWDGSGRTLAWNRAAEAMFGWPAVEVLGRDCPLLQSIRQEDVDLFERILGRARLSDEEVAARRADGTRTTVSLSTAPVFDDRGRVDSTVGVALDVAERRRRASEIRHLATHDPLTGLANRHALEQALERVVERVKRGGPPGALLILDLDRFKQVNDTHGHLVGDQMLVGVADALHDAMRPGDLLGRFGGDELAAVVDGVDAAEAILVAERLRAAVGAFSLELEALERTTASAGGAVIDGTLDATDVLAVADLALNDAKAQGKDRVILHRSPRAQALRLAAVTRWARRLRHALDHHEVEVHVQPVVDLRDGALHSQEALARLRLGRDLHMPDEFLVAAHQSGLIADLDRHVTMAALDLLADAAHPPVSVNLSRRSLGDLRIVRIVTGHPAAASIVGRLYFEVPEAALLAQLPELREWIAELAGAGALLAVDHVTLDRASRRALPQLPVALAKLDPALTLGAADPAVRAAVREAADAFRARGLPLVAGAVETEDARDRLLDLGLVLGQGYLYGRPAPV